MCYGVCCVYHRIDHVFVRRKVEKILHLCRYLIEQIPNAETKLAFRIIHQLHSYVLVLYTIVRNSLLIKSTTLLPENSYICVFCFIINMSNSGRWPVVLNIYSKHSRNAVVMYEILNIRLLSYVYK